MKPLVTALTNMRRTPYQSLSAILMITITFLVTYSFSFFLYTSHQILEIIQKPYTQEAKIVSQEEALELYRQSNQDDPMLLELVSAEILPASIEVSGTTLESLTQIKQDLEKVEAVEEVILQQNIVEALQNSIQKLQLVGLGSIVFLSLTSFLIILVITGMKVTHKRHGIHVMKIIGASSWFIRSPFVLEGAIYGLLGSFLGWLLMFIALLYLTPWLKDFVGLIPLFPIPWQVYAIQVGLGSLIGIILAAFASSLAVSRMMKR